MAQVGNVIFTISADLKNVQGQLRTLEGNFQTSFTKIEQIAKNFSQGFVRGFVGAFSVGALTGFGREVLNLADSLQNLHEQTGLSVELLSGLKSPLEEAGSSMDSFARGVFNLQKNLGNAGNDSDKVTDSIKRLGLNLNDLRNSSPDDFIKKVTDALGKIENPVERNTILFNLLGKSAKDLGPAFQELAGRFDELRAKGLSAADVKALDDVGDALTRLKNQALLLGAEGTASILRFFGVLRDVPKLGADLASATERFSKATGISKDRVEGMTSKEIISATENAPTSFTQSRQGIRNARDELLNLREEFNRVNATAAKVPQAPFKGFGDSAKKASKDITEMQAFLEGLDKQLAGIQGKTAESLFGPNVALAQQLDTQLEQFKEKLRNSGQQIPKGLDTFFGVLKEKIVGADQALRDLNDSLEETAKRQQALADEANEGVGILGTSQTKEERSRQFQAEQQLADLRKQLQIDSIDTRTPEGAEQKRQAQIIADFEATKKKIEEFALAAGQSNEESAAAVQLAWQKALNEINNKTDEVTEFQRRAMERAFDAMADLTKDVLGGQIKSWEDFGSRVKRVIDSIVSDWLTLQLKTAVLGPNFGAAGAPVGGLLGQLFGSAQNVSPSFGFGQRPANVQGPTFANGGFFSSAQGALGVANAANNGGFLSGIGTAASTGWQWLASLFHEGGTVGNPYAFRAVNPSVFAYAHRYHSGVADLGMNEVPAILQKGETVLPKGARMGGPLIVNINNNNPNFADRRSQAQVNANQAASLKVALSRNS